MEVTSTNFKMYLRVINAEDFLGFYKSDRNKLILLPYLSNVDSNYIVNISGDEATGRGAGPDLHGRVTDSDFTATPRRRRAHSTGRGGAPPGPAWIDDSDGGPADRQGPAGPTRSGARRGVSRARPDRAGQLADYPLLTA